MEEMGLGWGWRQPIFRLFFPVSLAMDRLGRGFHWKREVATEVGGWAAGDFTARRKTVLFVRVGRKVAGLV